MALGNQIKKGNWALLVNAEIIINRPNVTLFLKIILFHVNISRDIIIEKMMKKSPIRLMSIVIMAAFILL
jgi:hypothetical protein